LVANVSAELVSIGTEILLGEITDTNSVFMARALRDIGVNVFYMISVGDNRERIANVIRTSLGRSEIVITCGGLGPTVDDMTRQSVADATERDLVFHQELLDVIAERFNRYGVQMTENNRQQAYLPAGAVVVENPVGTAPAYIVEVGDKCVVSLPGVPREMKYLLQETVIPFLREKYGITEQVILARVLKTAGIGESSLDTMIGREILEGHNPTVGLAAHSGQIDVRVTAKASTRAQAQGLIAPVEAAIRERAGDYIFGVDDERLEDVFALLLREHEVTLAITETGIGGVIREQLAEAMGEVLVGSEVYDSPDMLREALGLDVDVTLAVLAEKAAQRLRARTGSVVSIAVVSRPDVDEDADVMAGTVVVVCTEAKTRQRVYGFGGRSADVQRFVGNWSTAVAWRLVKEQVTNAQL
jgi:nicotinamide-nucleotide amidase